MTTLALEGLGALLGIALIGWALRELRVYPLIGAGYRAKVLCTAIFGSGRPLDAQLLAQVSDDAYLLLRPFRVRVDYHQRQVTASLFSGCARTALHRDGLGATLLAPGVSSPVGRLPARRSAAVRGWTEAPGSVELQRLVDRAFEEPNPGRLRRTRAVVVVHDGTIIAERYAPGCHAGMPLPGWSMAKSVLNALVGVLVLDGRLSLEQREVLPEWRAPDPRAAITIEDLLRMRSGLRFSEVYGNPWSDVLHMLYNCHDTAAYAAGRPLAATPGTAFSYSSGTTNILSRIVRTIVGDEDYFGFPRRALFDRLGMPSAVLEPDGAGTFVCSSYMLATARDWARFGQLFVNGGRCDDTTIVSDRWIDFSTTPTPQSDGRFGAHWWLKLNPEIGGDSASARAIAADAFFAVGHEGQTLTVIPSKRLVVVRLGASIYIDAWNQAEFIAGIQEAV
ncbi:MAG TPA: serine hydrolase [Vicinamibacterales bacterium]|nr:serine hydrolase [Vicinamibacterales bacterium]